MRVDTPRSGEKKIEAKNPGVEKINVVLEILAISEDAEIILTRLPTEKSALRQRVGTARR
jgi:hypothetical protein